MDTPVLTDSLHHLPTLSDEAPDNQSEAEQVTFRDHLKNPSNYREWDNKLLGDIKRSIDSALRGAQTARVKKETGEINISQIKPTIPSYSSISFVGSSLRYNPASMAKNDSKSSVRGFKFNEQGQTPKFALQQLPLKSMKDEDWETNQSLQSERIPTRSSSQIVKSKPMRMKKHRNSESTNLTTLSNDGDCESIEPRSAALERKVPFASRYAKLQHAENFMTQMTQEDEEEEKTNAYEKEISDLKQELVNKDLQMKGLINLVKSLEKELAKTRERNEKENEAIDSMRNSICYELDQLNETLL